MRRKTHTYTVTPAKSRELELSVSVNEDEEEEEFDSYSDLPPKTLRRSSSAVLSRLSCVGGLGFGGSSKRASSRSVVVVGGRGGQQQPPPDDFRVRVSALLVCLLVCCVGLGVVCSSAAE